MSEFYFARQPIFDRTKSVFGYELLFRNGFENSCGAPDGETATLDILTNALFNTSIDRMVAGKRGLVNFTRELLLNDVIFLFSPDCIIVEVLEDIIPDGEVVAACQRLKKANYKIALDDFVASDLNSPLIPIANFVKVDFLQAKGKDRKLIAARLLPLHITLIAEKVETEEDYREGQALGYHLFQGYFFSKPVIRSGQQFAPSQVVCVRMLQAVFKDECDYKELKEIISSDLSLSYRVLKLANSPYFSFRTEITSIPHAIALMGCSELKRFVSLIAIGSSISNKPKELALVSLSRARMGEEIAPLIGYKDGASSLFLTGLFSLLDAMLGCSMEEALAELPIAQDIKSALLGRSNILRDTLDMIIAYERGEWEKFRRSASAIKLQEDRFPAIYGSAIEWATNIFKLI